MTRTCAAVVMLTLLLAGCPTQPGGSSPVDGVITISATQGPAPLTVAVSAEDSTSDNRAELEYAWDFGDGTTTTDVSATHTFAEPGRYVVTLRVTDSTGAEGVATQEVRVAGSGAIAVIVTDGTSGAAPLIVQFDGTQSLVADDTIVDYFWDFGDGETSQEPKPQHNFPNEGEFLVSLRIVTAGGVEAQTTTTISVGAPNASLQFNGTSIATLPARLELWLWSGFTVEIWVQAESEGGTAINVGDGDLTIELRPSENTITLTKGGVSVDASATNLAGTWHHVAAVCSGDDAAGSCVLYLDGDAIDELDVGAPIAVGTITIGSGFRGRIADVRLWGVARSSAQVAGNRGKRLKGSEAGLYGYWPLNEGSGQILHDNAHGLLFFSGRDGTLGLSTSRESADPAWSTDGPPI